MAHLYNEETISQAINTKWAGKTVHFAKETDSTNSWIKRLAKEGAEHGTLAVAEFQSAGRGRFDRKWEAPEGSSIMMLLVCFMSLAAMADGRGQQQGARFGDRRGVVGRGKILPRGRGGGPPPVCSWGECLFPRRCRW